MLKTSIRFPQNKKPTGARITLKNVLLYSTVGLAYSCNCRGSRIHCFLLNCIYKFSEIKNMNLTDFALRKIKR